ncbi:hypothetical protein PSTG_18965, partial [Puccinia striiformis f. sp. tritici PST-78]
MKLNLASSTGSMMATHSGHLRITNGDGTLTIPWVLYSPLALPPPTQMSNPTTTPEPTPRAKFLQQPSIYKQDVEALLADGSNFNRWKRGLTRIIHLCLGHNNFFDATTNYTKLSTQEQTCLLFLIQITVHDELSSLVDRFSTGTEAYDA